MTHIDFGSWCPQRDKIATPLREAAIDHEQIHVGKKIIMTILQESGRWISFVVCLLVVVDSTVSGFNYFEPTDVKELRLLGQVSATSCGSGSHCNSTSDCTSGIVESPQYIDILDNVEEICLADDFLSKNELHQGIKKDSNFSTTSSNLGNCTNVTKSLNGKMSTYYGLSFWIYASTPKWYLSLCYMV